MLAVIQSGRRAVRSLQHLLESIGDHGFIRKTGPLIGWHQCGRDSSGLCSALDRTPLVAAIDYFLAIKWQTARRYAPIIAWNSDPRDPTRQCRRDWRR